MAYLKKFTTFNKFGLGTNKVGGHNLFDNLADEDGIALVKAALDSGVTLLDTAFAYGFGRSEELIGQVIKDYDRSQLIIATKAAHDPAQNYAFNNSPEFLQASVDSALQRLDVDYIDIFYIHFPDASTDKRLAVQALQEMKEAGKIRAIGLSNFNLDQIKEANQDGYVDIVEDAYSLVDRTAEQTTWAYLQEHDIEFVPYYPLASGLLTGKYTKTQTFTSDDWQSRNPNFQGERYQAILAGVDILAEIGQAYNASPSQVALAWYLKNPNIAALIPGARIAAQLHDNLKALDVALSDEDYQKIDVAFK